MPQNYSYAAIAAIIFSSLFFIPVFPVLGIVFGIVALVEISKKPNLKGKGLAIAAIAVGAFTIVLQLLVVFGFYNFFTGIFGPLFEATKGGASKTMENCINKKPGLGKDMCVFFAVVANINQTESLDQDVCDKHIITPDLKSMCNALLKKDERYCNNIIDTESRIKCFGMVKELQNKQNINREDVLVALK